MFRKNNRMCGTIDGQSHNRHRTMKSSLLLYLERIGKLKNFQLLKAIYNKINLITTINYGKDTEKNLL